MQGALHAGQCTMKTRCAADMRLPDRRDMGGWIQSCVIFVKIRFFFLFLDPELGLRCFSEAQYAIEAHSFMQAEQFKKNQQSLVVCN